MITPRTRKEGKEIRKKISHVFSSKTIFMIAPSLERISPQGMDGRIKRNASADEGKTFRAFFSIYYIISYK